MHYNLYIPIDIPNYRDLMQLLKLHELSQQRKNYRYFVIIRNLYWTIRQQ